MTKEQFLAKWGSIYIYTPNFKSDIEALIATEIAKAQEVKLEDAQPQPALNPIEQAYERGEKIKSKTGKQALWYQKHDDDYYIDSNNKKFDSEYILDDLKRHPEKWELYTEPTEQPSSQVKLDNSFDKDRFEAMFRAVVASGVKLNFYFCKRETDYFIQQLDAYYAEKEKGGNNG